MPCLGSAREVSPLQLSSVKVPFFFVLIESVSPLQLSSVKVVFFCSHRIGQSTAIKFSESSVFFFVLIESVSQLQLSSVKVPFFFLFSSNRTAERGADPLRG